MAATATATRQHTGVRFPCGHVVGRAPSPSCALEAYRGLGGLWAVQRHRPGG